MQHASARTCWPWMPNSKRTDKIPSVRGDVFNNICDALQINQTLSNMHANLTSKQTNKNKTYGE